MNSFIFPLTKPNLFNEMSLLQFTLVYYVNASLHSKQVLLRSSINIFHFTYFLNKSFSLRNIKLRSTCLIAIRTWRCVCTKEYSSSMKANLMNRSIHWSIRTTKNSQNKIYNECECEYNTKEKRRKKVREQNERKHYA